MRNIIILTNIYQKIWLKMSMINKKSEENWTSKIENWCTSRKSSSTLCEHTISIDIDIENE